MSSATIKHYLPWVVATALFMEQLDSTIVNTAIPAMAASLQVTPLSLKAVVTSYILSLAVCIPVSGWMADRFGTRRVFGAAVALFTVSSVLCGLALGFFNSLQFSSMNSMAYADVETPDSSMASTIPSTFQHISMSFGLAFGSLITAWYLGDLPQTDRLAVTSALHHAFLTLGALAIVSSVSFWALRARDGESVSRGDLRTAE
jgi:MFS family permease